jgi:hypothetical protein
MRQGRHRATVVVGTKGNLRNECRRSGPVFLSRRLMFKAAYRRLSASLAIKEDKKTMKGGMPAVCRQYSNRGGKTDD